MRLKRIGDGSARIVRCTRMMLIMRTFADGRHVKIQTAYRVTVYGPKHAAMFSPAKKGDTGVWEKWLGTFTERDLRIGFLKLDAGAVYQAR